MLGSEKGPSRGSAWQRQVGAGLWHREQYDRYEGGEPSATAISFLVCAPLDVRRRVDADDSASTCNDDDERGRAIAHFVLVANASTSHVCDAIARMPTRFFLLRILQCWYHEVS